MNIRESGNNFLNYGQAIKQGGGGVKARPLRAFNFFFIVIKKVPMAIKLKRGRW